MPEDFVQLLAPLRDKDAWTPADHEIFNRYLDNCAEYTKMQREVATLNAIFPFLRLPEDKENRYDLMVNVNELNSDCKKFKKRVLDTAHRLAAGDPEKEPSVWRASECFNEFYIEEAEFFAFPDSAVTDECSFRELESEWGRYVDEAVMWGAPYDRIGQFLQKLALDFFGLAYEKTTDTDEASATDAERYYKASILAGASVQSLTCYGVFLQNNRRFIEAAQQFRMAMDKFGTEMNDADRAAVLDILGMLETDNELYEQARETLFAAVETIRKMFPDHALKYRPMLGKNLNRLGRTLLRLKENEEAKEYLLEALEINRELMKTDPYDFEPQVMEGLGDLGLFHAGEKDFDAIEKYFLEAIGIARKLAGEEKYFKTRLGFFLTAMAAVHEEMLDIEAAEREHNEAWEVYSELAEGEPEIYMVGLAKRSLMRADFYQQYKREERERSIWDAADAFVLAYNFTDDPTAVDIAFRAKEILENWELDAGEIGHRLNFQEAVRGNLLKKIKILMVNGEL